MKSYLRIHSPWSQLGLFFLLLGVGVLLTSFLSAGILLMGGKSLSSLSNIDFGDPSLTGVLKTLQAVSTVVIFLLPAFGYALISFRRRPLYFFGVLQSSKPVFYGLAILVMLVAFPLVEWLGQINERLPLAKWMLDMEKDAARQMDAFLKVRSGWDIYINLFVMALLPAICEEACFRGALQRILIQLFKSPWTGIVLSAICFSAFHMQFEGFIPRMFLGIILGALFWYSGSLWVNILAHFFYNGIQVLAVYYFPKYMAQEPNIPLYWVAFSGLLVLGLLLYMHKSSNTSYAKVYEFEEVNEQNPYIS